MIRGDKVKIELGGIWLWREVQENMDKEINTYCMDLTLVCFPARCFSGNLRVRPRLFSDSLQFWGFRTALIRAGRHTAYLVSR